MLGLIGSAIAGGIEGAASAAEDQAKGYIEDQRKTDIASQLSKMDEDKQLRIDAVHRAREIEDIPKKANATAAAAPILATGMAKAAVAQTAEPGFLDAKKNMAMAEGAAGLEQSRISAGATLGAERLRGENQLSLERERWKNPENIAKAGFEEQRTKDQQGVSNMRAELVKAVEAKDTKAADAWRNKIEATQEDGKNRSGFLATGSKLLSQARDPMSGMTDEERKEASALGMGLLRRAMGDSGSTPSNTGGKTAADFDPNATKKPASKGKDDAAAGANPVVIPAVVPDGLSEESKQNIAAEQERVRAKAEREKAYNDVVLKKSIEDVSASRGQARSATDDVKSLTPDIIQGLTASDAQKMLDLNWKNLTDMQRAMLRQRQRSQQ